MTLSKNPQNWLFMILMIIFLFFVLIVYKHHRDDADLLQRVNEHFEIGVKM